MNIEGSKKEKGTIKLESSLACKQSFSKNYEYVNKLTRVYAPIGDVAAVLQSPERLASVVAYDNLVHAEHRCSHNPEIVRACSAEVHEVASVHALANICGQR